MNKHILAIDQGTTNTKVILVNEAGQSIAGASKPVSIHFPKPAWVEQDVNIIWQSVKEAIDECLTKANHPKLAAIGITNQRESVLVWERKTGEPLGPVITWQCRRSAPFCETLREKNLATTLQQKTGLTIDPLFSASKARWLLENIPNGKQRAANGELCIGTIDSWVLWNLTGGQQHRCDVSNASRTQLLNLHTLSWDDELLNIFEIPRAALPEIMHSSTHFGESLNIGALPSGVPITSLIGDSHAALFGQAGFEECYVKATYGTGSSLMIPTPNVTLSQQGLSSTIAWGLDNATYALEGNISVTGSAVQWLEQLLELDAGSITKLASSITSTDGLYLVPAFVGLGAPHWADAARGLLTGLTRGSSRAQLARATLESIAYQIRDVFDVMKNEAKADLNVLLADGGGSRNAWLMGFQADILGVPVLANTSADLSALGAAYLAGLHMGMWKTLTEIAGLERKLERYEPKMSNSQREERYTGWREAIARTTYKP
ncbi:MAG: FGGY family carbohydrate kinase [Trueperaceae bacterium]